METESKKFREQEAHSMEVKSRKTYGLAFVQMLVILFLSCGSFNLLNYSFEEQGSRVNTLVRVLDYDGSPVEGLTINDFYVWEDRVPIRENYNLQINDIDPLPELYTVVLFDNSSAANVNFDTEKHTLLTFIDVQPAHMKIKLIALSPKAIELTDFTDDKELLREVVSNISLGNDNLDLYTGLDKSSNVLNMLPYGPTSFPVDGSDFPSTIDKSMGFKRIYSSAVILITNGNNSNINNGTSNNIIDNLSHIHKFIISVDTHSRSIDPTFFRDLVDGTDMRSSVVKSRYYPLESMNDFFDTVQNVWETAAKITKGYYILSYNSHWESKSTHNIKLELNQIRANNINFQMDFVENPSLDQVKVGNLGVNKNVPKPEPDSNVKLTREEVLAEDDMLPLEDDALLLEDDALFLDDDALFLDDDALFLDDATLEDNDTPLEDSLELEHVELLEPLEESSPVSSSEANLPETTSWDELIELDQPNILGSDEEFLPDKAELVYSNNKYTGNNLPLIGSKNVEYLQIASFTEQLYLDKTIANLASLDNNLNVVRIEIEGNTYYRCIVGPIKTGDVIALEEYLYGLGYYDLFRLPTSFRDWIKSGAPVITN